MTRRPPHSHLPRGLAGPVIALGVLIVSAAFAAAERVPAKGAPGRGAWSTARGNRQLTGFQPLPGQMRAVPGVVAKVALPTGAPALVPFAAKPGGEADRAIGLVDGGARCYDLQGKLLWETH